MNLIDAIKSGRPFRRRGLNRSGRKLDFCWLVARPSDIGGYGDGDFVFSDKRADGTSCEGVEYMTPEDILADDWEIQEPTVTITRTALFSAMNDVAACMIADGKAPHYGDTFGREVARKLGLEGP